MSFPNFLQRMTERIYKTTKEKNVNEKEKKYEKNIKNKTSWKQVTLKSEREREEIERER